MDKYDYLTDLLDVYANMAHDGHILSKEQKEQVMDARDFLVENNGVSQYQDLWIELAESLID